MLTKEELLQKGISEEIADEIIKSYTDNSQEDDSLETLQKALNEGTPATEDLSKAEKKGDKDDSDGEKDDYNESYMKKHMKRYMKEKGKVFEDKDDDSEKDMKKAIDDIDLNSEGAVVEMADLTPFLNTLGPIIASMSKAIPELAERIEIVSAQAEKNYDLMQKAAKVTAENAENMSKFLDMPNGRKGVIGSAEMQKAQVQKSSNEQNKMIHGILMKAVREKDRTAGQIISVFESSGQNIDKLKPAYRKYVNDLIKKEAN